MIRELEFKVLCHRHQDQVYRYALVLLGNRPDAEDATQEVLLRLWNHLPRIIPLNIRAWLLKTTRHYCLDQIRRRSNRFSPIPLDGEMLTDRPDEIAVDPSYAADCNLRIAQARKVLLDLPENLRSVFVLYEVNGLRYREIAATLGIPVNSVKVYLFRARKELSNLMKKEETWTNTCKS